LSDDDHSDDRTEDPSAKRRKEFRDEGRVPQSRDVPAAVLGAIVLAGIAWVGPPMAREAFGVMTRALDRIADVPEGGVGVLWEVAYDAAAVMALVVLGTGVSLAGCSAVVGVAQTGGLWSGKLLEFKLDRLGLISGLRRTFASGEMLTQLGLTIAKAAAISAALYMILVDEIQRLPGLLHLAPDGAVHAIGALLFRVAVWALAVTGVLAAADYLLNYRKIQSQLRMTKQEVKDELKQQEGDPHVRQRLRARMRQIGRNRMLAAVATADVVVVNPTHYAVALRYKPGEGGAPRLVAKGVDHVAAKIREVARKHQVPIVANPPVARAIHAAGKVGREIPAELYEVVARVLAYVYRMTRWRNAG
jgi:flagellar biosynthetic protein FlhB